MTEWSEETIEAVWQKGRPAKNTKKFPSHIWRVDDFKLAIKRSEYGKRNTKYGWEIDHIKPKSQNGSDHISNLRPLHWRKNIQRN